MQRCIGGEQEIAIDIFHPLRNYYYARELPGLGSIRISGILNISG